MQMPPRYREYYEGQEYEGFAASLVANVLSRCRLFVDVGAHAGFFSLLAAHHHPELEILAFEPTPASFTTLGRNLAMNGCRNATAFPEAVSDADGLAPFYISAASDNCSFYPHPHAPPLQQVEVKTSKLDTVLANRPPVPTLLKVDTDGHELAVLRGLSVTLSRYPDLSLLIEFNPKMQRAAAHEPEALLRELDRLGFAMFLLDEGKRRPFRLHPDAGWKSLMAAESYANLYCVRRERALNICLFSHSPGMGGAERSLLELTRELIADHGALCTVVVPGEGALLQELKQVGAACVRADYPWWCDLNSGVPAAEALARMQPGASALLRELLPVLRTVAPDVCLTQTLVIPWGAVAAALLGKPHVWSVCEYGEKDHGLRFFVPFPTVTKEIGAASQLVYTNSRDLREELFKDLPEQQCRHLYRHVPIPAASATPNPTGLFKRPQALRVGLFGTVSEGKGQADSVRAVGRLTAEGRDVELLLAGSLIYPAYTRLLEDLMAEGKLTDRVRLPGCLADPYPAMRECDVVLVCSRSEAFGRVAVEAMLLGKPVIYAAAGGPQEYMQPGVTGLPYPPGDDAALARCLATLQDQPEQRAALGEQAQRFASARFSREGFGGEVFRSLLALARNASAPIQMPAAMQSLVGNAVLDLAAENQATHAQAVALQTALAQAGQEVNQVRAHLASLERELEHAGERAQALQSSLDARRAELASCQAALTATRQELGATQAAQTATRAELASTQATLETTGARLEATSVALNLAQRERQQTAASLQQAQAELAAMVQSPAWKLTKPLRSLGKRAAEVRELTRRGVVRLHLTRRTRQVHRAAKLIGRSGLFDAPWYRQQYPVARVGRADPVLHYLRRGWREGCDPNPLFDSRFYLQLNRDVAAEGMNPLLHYLEHGAAEGRDPNPLFDTDWYLAQNPDVAAAGLNPLAHFLTHGGAEGRSPSAQFDAAFYLAQYPDVRASGMNPLVHYRLHGQAEGRGIRPIAVQQPVIGQPVQAGATASRARRIVFVSGEPQTPGHDYRVQMYAKALAGRGYDTHIVPLPQLPAELGRAAGADVVFIWRAAWSRDIAALVTLARKQGAKIVFDVDDLMIDPALAKATVIDGIRSQGFQESAIADMYRGIQQAMLAADFCTCTTRPLASAMRRFQKTTFVLPNGFDDVRHARSRQAVAARRRQPGDGLIRLGYAGGSKTHQKDFACAAPGVARILREHPECRLVLFRLELPSGNFQCVDPHEFPDFAGLDAQIEWRPFVPVQELPFQLARFDINLAPLETDNVFCEAKSELKYFEAALVNVPTVASPTQPYSDAMQEGKTGFLAKTDDDWYVALKRLVCDANLRRQMGQAACLDVLWRFGPERRAELACGVFEQILTGEGASAARRFELELRRAAAPRRAPPECAEYDVVFESGTAAESEVAVVVPLYNYAAHVVEALESVKAQTVRARALVVVEDCSTDDSLRVAEDWLRQNAAGFTQVALLRNRQNSGLARTRNAGFAFADAPFILPLDADNMILPECLERCLKTLQETGAAVAFATIQEFGDSHGKRSADQWKPGRFTGGNYIDAMALIRRSAWAAVGGYQRMTVMGWEDYELWCRFIEEGLWGVWVPEALARYRVHRHSMLQTRTDIANNRARLAAEMKVLHPWVDATTLAGMPEAPPPPPTDAAAAAAEVPPAPATVGPAQVRPAAGVEPRPRNRQRLEELLPLLRCPVSGQALKLLSDRQLATVDGRQQWPLVDWHPIFFGDAAETRRFADAHLSNPVPARAMALIENATGPVLNMSAGGTRTWLPHCVELETAIFRNTDVVGDGHALPFADGVFEAVLAINAFEHYREPDRVVAEILRVLKPGGKVFIHTAFLQPLHEPPWHFFNCTKFGLLQWFDRFEVVDLTVSDNFHPIYALAWQADDLLGVLRSERGAEAAARFGALSLQEIAAFWNQPACQRDARWAELRQLSQAAQERLSAGFEFIGRKSGSLPDSHKEPAA
jgi:FkbM family methyltransferase